MASSGQGKDWMSEQQERSFETAFVLGGGQVQLAAQRDDVALRAVRRDLDLESFHVGTLLLLGFRVAQV